MPLLAAATPDSWKIVNAWIKKYHEFLSKATGAGNNNTGTAAAGGPGGPAAGGTADNFTNDAAAYTTDEVAVIFACIFDNG
jgi:hypothetical protein